MTRPDCGEPTQSPDIDQLHPEPDDDETRDPSHCWHHAGCPDCDRRAAWIEAGRP